ncbi:MAG: GNAT family N-acetyltransferase [Nitrospirota bacterium]
MYRYEQVDVGDERWWSEARSYRDSTVFQTRAWITFVATTQCGTPVLAALKDGERTVGYFAGLIVKKFGIRILGSPCPGWSTDYMGFVLEPGASRTAALRGLFAFAFDQLGCVHVEVMDRHLTQEDLLGSDVEYRVYHGFAVDLNQDEAALFGNFTSACRRCVRKADKEGVVVEVAQAAGFAEDYFDQLWDVFAKQGLVPTYRLDRVKQLIAHLHPTGQALLLRARDRNGRSIATGIFPFLNGTMYFWGGASWREFHSLRPNQALHWFAMRYAKAHDAHTYDMGGGGEYKRQYGGQEIHVPWIRKSKYGWIEPARDFAQSAYKLRQRVLGRIQHAVALPRRVFHTSSVGSRCLDECAQS